ncbi:MAG: dihydrofolate reductase, partial [Nanoarchaeota archaeon]
FAEGKDPYVIGGSKIYKLFLPVADELEITRVHRNYDGDSSFPSEIEWNEWKLIDEKEGVSNNENIPYSFLTYKRLFNGKRMINE